MGLVKTLVRTAGVVGVTVAVLKYPDETKSRLEQIYNAAEQAITPALKKHAEDYNILRPLQQPNYPKPDSVSSTGNDITKTIQEETRPKYGKLTWNGQEIPSVDSNGNQYSPENWPWLVWPDQFPRQNPDGSFNRAYVRWLKEQSRH